MSACEASWGEKLMFSTSFWGPPKMKHVYSVHASTYHLGKSEESLILCRQIDSNPWGKAPFYFYISVASVSGPGNHLVMDIRIDSLCNKFQDLLYLTLEEKGQIDFWGD